METKCPEAIVVLMLQSCTGVFFQSLMTGIIFAKLSRPKNRSSTIRFSKNAVVCQRDGRFCLLFRLADMRKSHIVSAIVRAVMVKNVITKEGEPLPLAQSLLKTEAENGGEDNSVYLLWPTTVIHWIDEDSPFWKMSAEEMLTERFEIVVFLEATIESTGMTTQVCTFFCLFGNLDPIVSICRSVKQGRDFHDVTAAFISSGGDSSPIPIDHPLKRCKWTSIFSFAWVNVTCKWGKIVCSELELEILRSVPQNSTFHFASPKRLCHRCRCFIRCAHPIYQLRFCGAIAWHLSSHIRRRTGSTALTTRSSIPLFQWLLRNAAQG